jgi:hypothetical protein
MTTASVSSAAGLPAGVAPAEVQRTSLETYRKMIDLGLLLPTNRVELLDGFLVKKMTKRRHPGPGDVVLVINK